MKIGIMLRHYEQLEGGVKHYTKSLLPLLFTLAPQHRYVLVYQNPKLLGTYSQYPNVEERVVRMPGTVLWDQIAFPWATRGMKLDVVFNPKFTIPLFHRAKKVWVLHGSEWWVIPKHFKWWDIAYVAASLPFYTWFADAFIAVCQVVKDDILKVLKTNPDKIFPIHNGIDPKRFYFIDDAAKLADVRARYKLPDKYILWVGQIGTRKNIQRLFQAFAQIAREFPHDLVIAGEQRKLQGAKEALSEIKQIKELGLEHRIKFLGWVGHEDLPAIYRMADLYAFPSLYEGFGIPLIEAMACGCPIVTATTCAPPEVCAGAAELVDPYDVEAITQGMRKVLSDPALREKMIARGLERAKDFGWEKCARQVLGVFDWVAGSTRRA